MGAMAKALIAFALRLVSASVGSRHAQPDATEGRAVVVMITVTCSFNSFIYAMHPGRLIPFSDEQKLHAVGIYKFSAE